MKSLKTVPLNEMQVGDIIRIHNLQHYISEGDEITELVEKFADTCLTVQSIGDEINEWGERTYVANNYELGTCTFTDHEIARVYRIVEVALWRNFT